jgi:L-seryl-tRNA(Ser) seleniumtransferase
MLLFLNAADPQGRIHHEAFVEIGKKHRIPTMIDAAADVPPMENLWRFTNLGFDMACFSGGKGLRGPQSAGLLLGRKDLIAAARLNNNPHADSLCRSNKVNKEEIVGMLVALELFLSRDHGATWNEWEGRCHLIAEALSGLSTVRTEVFVPAIANATPHLRVIWDYKARSLTPPEAVRQLREGEPSIEVRPGSNEALEIAVWMLEPKEEQIVARRLAEILRS